jgi:DNA-binding XRE family transcriptional regulator
LAALDRYRPDHNQGVMLIGDWPAACQVQLISYDIYNNATNKLQCQVLAQIFGMSNKQSTESKTLKELLKERRVNKTALAKRIGVSRQQISRWEDGLASMTLDNAVAIASDEQVRVSLKELARLCGVDVSRVPDDDPLESDPWQN